MKSNQTNWNQTTLNQTNQFKQNQMELNQIEPNETKPNKSKPNKPIKAEPNLTVLIIKYFICNFVLAAVHILSMILITFFNFLSTIL
jgi:hypothetical protein